MKRQVEVHNIVASLLLLCILNACDKEDRTTVIYGKVTNQNQKAVDSILVTASGLWGLYNLEIIKQIYTDENGSYELVIDVAKKYNKLDIGIPYDIIENSKFQYNYDIDIVWKNSKQTNNCCTAIVGEKTEYNFQLKSRK